MKIKIVLLACLFCAGCLPASQQEVIALTEAVSGIIPVVREVTAESSQETKDKIEIVLGQVEEMNEAVATAEDPIEAVSKGWDASKPFNPYYGYGAAILAALKLFSDGKKKKEVEDKYSAAKIGMDKFRNANPSKARELYIDVGEARKAKKII